MQVVQEKNQKIAVVFGSATSLLLERLNLTAPYGKVLILSTLKSYISLGEKIRVGVKDAGGQPLNLVEGEDFNFTVDTASGLFSFSEDVRAVVATDFRLFALASYFATIKDIPCYYLVENNFSSSAFARKLPVKNQNDIDFYTLREDRTVIFEEEGLTSEEFLTSLFAIAVEYAVKRLDNAVVGQILGAPAVGERVELLDLAVNRLLYNEKIDKKERISLIELYAKIEESAFIGGENLSALDIAKYIRLGNFCADNRFTIESGYEILSTERRLLLEGNGLNIPDYRERASSLSFHGFDEDGVLHGLYSQAKKFEEVTLRDIDLIKTLVEKSYYALKKIRKRAPCSKNASERGLNEAIFLSGDTPFSTNAMTALRELGY